MEKQIKNKTKNQKGYDKPLLVNTLCKTCHTIQHFKNFGGGYFGRQ